MIELDECEECDSDFSDETLVAVYLLYGCKVKDMLLIPKAVRDG
jgi:hypothetical protein